MALGIHSRRDFVVVLARALLDGDKGDEECLDQVRVVPLGGHFVVFVCFGLGMIVIDMCIVDERSVDKAWLDGGRNWRGLW